MPKRVLGNDPFERGAAQRPAAPKETPPPAAARPKPATPPKGARAPPPRPPRLQPPAPAPPLAKPPLPPVDSDAPASASWATTAGAELHGALSVLRSAAEAV